jgi:hypothetical protein
VAHRGGGPVIRGPVDQGGQISAEPVPLAWRELLGEVFVEAERHGLGTYTPAFAAAPGREEAAARFIGERASHLSELRLGDAS